MAEKESMVMTAFQTACLAIIVLIAKFIGDLIYHAINSGFAEPWLFSFLILVSGLNFFELTNNLVSIKKYFKCYYNGWLFLIDVITLGCFFWQIYILSKLGETCGNEPDSGFKMVQVAIWFYCGIFFLYILWNAMILWISGKNGKAALEPANKEKIQFSAIMRVFQLFISLVMILCGIQNISMGWLNFCVGLSILYVGYHNVKMDVFNNLINTKEKDK